MKPLPLLAALLALGCADAPAQNNQGATPPAAPSGRDAEQQALMDRIEREVRLPRGAGPVASYARFYAWQQQRGDGVRKVVAVYENLTGAASGRRWVTEREFPVIMDGGCGVVSLSYDVATQRIEHVSCNGLA
jgi:hypothetical protein